MRAHVNLPEKLVGQIDRLVGQRKRSRFIAEAIQEKLEREALLDALQATAGIFSDENHPEWSTAQKVARWQRAMRKDNARVK